jgi:hypothetical protein
MDENLVSRSGSCEETCSQFSLYDVILDLEMPESGEEKNDMMSHIKIYLESIKNDTCLQNYVIAKYNSTAIEHFKGMSRFDWDDLQIEIVNIFFGFETHCLIKIKMNNSEGKYDIQTIQKINSLIKIHVESIDTFTKRKFKLKNTNDWRGKNSKEISIKLTWDESLFGRRSSRDEIKEAAIDLIRKIPSEMKSEVQKKNLKDKLTNEYGIIPQDVDELLRHFEMIPALTKKDAREINIELSRQLPSPMRTIFTNIPLWPYMERKLNEIDDAQIRTGFKGFCSREGLPDSISRENLRELSQSQERFAPQLTGNQEIFFFYVVFIFFIFF